MIYLLYQELYIDIMFLIRYITSKFNKLGHGRISSKIIVAQSEFFKAQNCLFLVFFTLAQYYFNIRSVLDGFSFNLHDLGGGAVPYVALVINYISAW